MSFTPYKIEDDLTVKVYIQGKEGVWILQPNHPDNRDWNNRAEAETFAKEYAELAAKLYAEHQLEESEEIPSE